MRALKLQNKFPLLIITFAFVTIASLLYVFYEGCSTRSLIGQKVIIDGKELTITSVNGSDVILSDRTRVDKYYAKTLLRGTK